MKQATDGEGGGGDGAVGGGGEVVAEAVVDEVVLGPLGHFFKKSQTLPQKKSTTLPKIMYKK